MQDDAQLFTFWVTMCVYRLWPSTWLFVFSLSHRVSHDSAWLTGGASLKWQPAGVFPPVGVWSEQPHWALPLQVSPSGGYPAQIKMPWYKKFVTNSVLFSLQESLFKLSSGEHKLQQNAALLSPNNDFSPLETSVLFGQYQRVHLPQPKGNSLANLEKLIAKHTLQ